MRAKEHSARRLIAYFLQILLLMRNPTPIVSSLDVVSDVRSEPCSLTIRGGEINPTRQQVVQAVDLTCREGELAWSEASGALLVRYSVKSLVDSTKPTDTALTSTTIRQRQQLCVEFLGEFNHATSNISVTRMEYSVDGKLDSSPLNLADTHCTALHYAGHSPKPMTMALLVKVDDDEQELENSLIIRYELTDADVSVNAPPPEQRYCGNCNDDEFLNAYRSSNFIFNGRLIGEMPRGNALEYTVERSHRKPFVTPPNLISKVHPKSGIRTTVLRSHCPKGSIKVAGFQHEYVVVASVTKADVAQLACALTVREFGRLERLVNSTMAYTEGAEEKATV